MAVLVCLDLVGEIMLYCIAPTLHFNKCVLGGEVVVPYDVWRDTSVAAQQLTVLEVRGEMYSVLMPPKH